MAVQVLIVIVNMKLKSIWDATLCVQSKLGYIKELQHLRMLQQTEESNTTEASGIPAAIRKLGVHGPSQQGVHQVLEAWPDRVCVFCCLHRPYTKASSLAAGASTVLYIAEIHASRFDGSDAWTKLRMGMIWTCKSSTTSLCIFRLLGGI